MNPFSRESLQDPESRRKYLFVILGLLVLFFMLDEERELTEEVTILEHAFRSDFNDPRIVGVVKNISDARSRSFILNANFYDGERRVIKVVEGKPIYDLPRGSARNFEISVSGNSNFDSQSFLKTMKDYSVEILPNL